MEHPVTAHEQTFKEINEKLFRGQQKIITLEGDLKHTMKSVTALDERMSARDEELKAITKLAYSVETLSKDVNIIVTKMDKNNLEGMAKSIDALETGMETIKDKVITLENRPAKTVSKYAEDAFIYACMIAIGFFLNKILGG